MAFEVEAINFLTPFCLRRKGACGTSEAAKAFNIPLKTVNAGNEYLKIVRNPKFGYGKKLNPCVDCRIFIYIKAKKRAGKIGAELIFTEEVLGQRPVSQHKGALDLIERQAGLEGRILRPLSVKHLPKTEAEIKGFAKNNMLRDICRPSRKQQLEITREFNITNYPCSSGGCLLTNREFAKKLRDLFIRRVTVKDVNLLKVGRHFRFGKNRIIVGRNEEENKLLLRAKTEMWLAL